MVQKNTNTEELSYVKPLSLIILTLQSTIFVLVGKSATIKSAPEKFNTSTVVLISEICKFMTFCIILLIRCRSVKLYFSTLYEEILIKYKNTLKVSVPAFLYMVQNNLLLVGIDNLPAAVFQVSSQLKILTTALMSYVLLKKKLSLNQWISMVSLFSGVILVNIKFNNTESGLIETESKSEPHGNVLLGLTTVSICALTSAFSGVYYEKLLKQDKFDLVISNIQLSGISVILCVVTTFITNFEDIRHGRMFRAFNIYVWFYIVLLAFGGMVISVVVKYADNILKGFSTSVAIIFSSILSYFLFSFQFTIPFMAGATLVILSVLIYSYG